MAHFLDWVAPELGGLRLAVEVRSADLMTPAFAKFLLERKIALVLVDRVNTPDLFSVWMEAVETNPQVDFSMIRWIGDDQDGPSGNQEISAPRDGELDRWADRIVQLAQRGQSIYGYMHNPYEGHSPASVQRLLTRLADKIPHPPWPPEAWQWDQTENSDDGNQLSLFDVT